MQWKTAGILLIVLAGSMPACVPHQAERPNILLIMVDDMGYSDVGCYGGEVDTPNIDRLAADGLRFTQFYNTARCCPTRASLLTGLYPHQAGIGRMVIEPKRENRGYEGRLMPRCVTIGEVLKTAGYQTAVAGKWHVSPYDYKTGAASMPKTWPLQRGFDRFYGTIAGGGSYAVPPGLMRGNEPIAPEGGRYYYTDAISGAAVQFLQDMNTETNAPWFLYVAYTAPHWPIQALPEDIAKYRERYRAGWDRLRHERFQRMQAMGLLDPRWTLPGHEWDNQPWEAVEHPEWEVERMAVYAAMIDRVDQGIGRLLAALEETGEADNTLVMFLADNGGCNEVVTGNAWGAAITHMQAGERSGRNFQVGNDPAVMPGPDSTFQTYGPDWAHCSNTPFRRYKRYIHEGGISTPFIVRWPAAIRTTGEMTPETGHVIDLMATCIDVAGAEYPETFNGNAILPLEGKSLAPVLKTGTREGHEALYWEHYNNRAIRRGKWKLVADGELKESWELYDTEADRTETNNLIAQHPELAQELADAWTRWAKRTYVTEE